MINLFFKLDTRILGQFDGVVTAVVGVGMIVIAGKFMIKGSIQNAIFSVVLCGLLLWAVNDLNGFVNFIKVIIGFLGGVLGDK